MRIDKNTTIRLGDRNIVKIKIGDVVIWQKSTEPVVGPDYFYIENVDTSDGEITFTTTKRYTPTSGKYAEKIEYSSDKANWNTINFNTTTPQTVTIKSGEKVYLRNNSGFFNFMSYYGHEYTTTINTTKKCVVGGNLNSLLDYNNLDNIDISEKESCFEKLFYNATNIIDASILIIPSTTLASSCYKSMFKGCTGLTSAPTLPATTLASSCYSGMFGGCTSLTTAPALPATTLAYSCYSGMFGGCTSLTSAPELPATTLADSCYISMFNGCNSLTTAPALPATTLAYSCYSGMFGGCTKLNSITVYADDISASSCTKDWLSGVSSTGTFNNMSFAPFENGASGIPSGWTEVVPSIQSITTNPDTFTIKSYKSSVTCKSTLTITTTSGRILTKTNSATITVGENTGDTTRTIVETIPYQGSSYQVTIIQTANDVRPPMSWNVVSEGTYPFQLNSNGYYESTNKGKSSSYSYATLNYSGFENLVLECINSGESGYDYGIISQPDVQLSESTSDDGATGSTKVFKNFKGQSSTNPVQLTIPSDKESHFITIKFRKDGSGDSGNDSLQFRVIEPTN